MPTPEAYERALDQWRRLPGAVSGPAAEPHPDAEGQFPADTADEGSSEFDKKSADTEEYDGPLPATDPGDNRAYERRQR